MKCPNCGASNRKDNKFCKKCGEELNPTLEENVSDVVEEKEDSKKSSKKKKEEKKKEVVEEKKEENKEEVEDKEEDKSDTSEEVVKEKKEKKKMSRKKMIMVISIVIGVILLVCIGGFIGWQVYRMNRSTGSSWGDTYYEYIKESREKDSKKEKIPNDSVIEFVQVDDINDPVMLVEYEDSDEVYHDIYYINEDKVENVIALEPSDVMLLYHLEDKKYTWYSHSREEDSDTYTPLKDVIDSDAAKDEDSYSFKDGEDITVETVDGEVLSMPEFDSVFVDTEVKLDGVDYSEDISLGDLKEVMIDGVNDYKPNKEITTDKVKEEVEKKADEATKKKEEIEQAKAEVEKKKQEEEAMKITDSNIQQKIGTHLKWFEGAYFGVIYGWPKVFNYKEVTDSITIPTAECNGAMIYEVEGLHSIASLKSQLSNYVSSSIFSKFDSYNFVDMFTEYNNQVYWCNMGVGGGMSMDTEHAKVLSSENGVSKIKINVYHELGNFISENIILTVTYNKDNGSYLITDFTVQNLY